jgi:hypothetical protein
MMSKKLAVLISFSAAALLLGAAVPSLYLRRETRPVVFCGSPDDSIRPKKYCLMNPFRDKRPEFLAEEALRELKNGNSDVISSLLEWEPTKEGKKGFIESERKYRVSDWRIGGREDSEETVFLTYWVFREDYFDGRPESVNFLVVRDGQDWKLQYFNAVY